MSHPIRKKKINVPLTEEQKSLVEKYHKLAFKAANYFISRNAVYQRYEYCALDAATNHLIICARYYDASRGVTFKTYYYHSVNRRIYDTVIRTWKQDMKDMNNLYALRDDKFNESARPNRRTEPTLSQIANRDYIEHLIEEAKLTPEQRFVLDDFMSIKGDNRAPVEWFKAEQMGITRQALDGRIKRALEKLRVTARKI